MKGKFLVICMTCFLFHSLADGNQKEMDKEAKEMLVKNGPLYHQAQNAMRRNEYKKALTLFEKFIFSNQEGLNTHLKEKLFWSIDLSMRIYLRIQKNPEGAIKLLSRIDKKFKFNDADMDIIQEWSSVAKEWKKMGKIPKNITSEAELFKLGKKYYEQGMKKRKFPADDKGKADLYIASSYLVPIVYNYNDSKNIGEVLLMLGTIRRQSWNDSFYWSENFYLKEVIHRFPHTELARKAYKVLEEGIRFGYTGSGGDFTPPSQLKMLKVYKKISSPTKKKKPVFY